MEQSARAPFYERLSVISLILSKLNNEFRRIANRENILELVFGRLKTYKESQEAEEQPFRYMEQLLEEYRLEYEGKKKAGLLTRDEQYEYRDAGELLGRYAQAVRGETENRKDEVFSRLADLFGKDREEYETLCRDGLGMLEYAFDFMEGTFGDSQEMVIFITELNTSYYAVRFMEENECERYFQYNKRLLFEDREKDILTRLDRLS